MVGFGSVGVILFFCLLHKVTSGDSEKYRKCDIHHFDDCPNLTTCTQTGECQCWTDYIYNPAHEKNASAEYCVYKPSSHHHSSINGASSGSTTGSSASTTSLASSSASSTSKTASAISQHEPPGAHHLIGGILIPVLFVLAILGVVYTVKRLNLMRRAREAFTRRNRPFYEDVMMGNDNDDPPLI